jgi:site-specific recombinase XerD
MYLLYLRISELAANDRWIPMMNHFYQKSDGSWWFKVVGKGNKFREIAVSDDMLAALKRYREKLQLTPLPSPNEKNVLIYKENGKGAITDSRHIRRLIQHCFDKTINNLREFKFNSDADTMESATVHWLRHTGISDDINKRGRPIAHVRDDAGHSSSSTTDRYNDIELKDRYQSAKQKKLTND